MSRSGKAKFDSKPWDVPTRPSALSLVLWLLGLIAIFIIQMNVSMFGVFLNLIVLVPFYVGVRSTPEKGLLAGIGVGFFQDGLGLGLIGPNMLSKGVVGLLSPLMAGKFFIWTRVFGMVTMFTMTFLDGWMVYASKSVFQSISTDLDVVFRDVLIQSLINAPLGYLIKPRDA
ncbi:MAG: hypothetical protein ACWGN7_03390 [Thermodesulfovibrionales bacterium]